MPKSAKKSASKAVSTPAAAEQLTKPTKNGKRNAEEIVEKKVVNGKKQKIVNGGVIKKNTKAQKKKNKKQEIIKSDSDKEDEEEEKEEAMNVDDAAKNEVDSDNESGSDDDENGDEEEANDASEPASKAEEGSGDDGDESSEEEGSSEEEDEPETAKKTDAPPSTGSKTLFVGNLSFSVKEDDLVDFFKDAGEVHEVRLAMRDGRFSGYGHVEFTTPDAAQKALELNNELLLDRAVRLDLAKEKGAFTPGNERSSQKSGQSQVRTVFVRGFGTDDGFDDVRSSLEEHFGKCGEISRMSIPKDNESGGPKGVAFIDFEDNKAFGKALDLSGSEVNGGTITVEEAKPRGGDGGSGRGGRGGGRGFGGGRGGGRGFGGGRGGGRGDRFGGGRGGGRGRGGGGGRGRDRR